MMKKLLLHLWDKVVDHIVGVVVATLLSTTVILGVFTRDRLISLVILPILLWRWSGWIFAALILAAGFIYSAINKRAVQRQRNNDAVISEPPRYYASFDQKTDEREFAGVIWKIVIGTGVDPSTGKLSRESVWAWPHPRPFCLECGYQLERQKRKWHCLPCKRDYKIPRELRENTWEKVRRNFERFIVQWGWNNFGLADETHKPFRVTIREMKQRRGKEDEVQIKDL